MKGVNYKEVGFHGTNQRAWKATQKEENLEILRNWVLGRFQKVGSFNR
jgi:rhamnogalacturonyl hydrolase YesR